MAERIKAAKRRLIQLYSALLYNAHIRGFIDGRLYAGSGKGFCVPGLNCYSCPGAVASCPLGALQQALSEHTIPYYVLGILILFGLLLGRRICGWLCPVGLVQELLHKIPSPKLKKNRVTRLLSYVKYGILALFVVVLPLVQLTPAFCKYICPAGTAAGIMLILNPANEEIRSLLGALFTNKLTIFLLLIAASVFIYRVFCRFLCPLGALYGLFAKISLLGIEVDEGKCNNCGACIRSCPMDIKAVGDRECIQCGDCRCVCKQNAVSFRKLTASKRSVHGYAQGIWLGIILVIIICLVNFVPKNEKKFEIGALSPDFAVKLNGSDEDIFTLNDAEGKVTVLNLWASWCSPCVEELPLLQKAYEERDINLVAVHYGEPDARAENLMAQYSIPFAVDDDGSFASLFGDAQLLPQTVVIDADGTVLSIRVGRIDEGFAEENTQPKSLTSYTIKATDTEGNGIDGVKLSVCRGDVCRLLMTDAAGMAVFEDEYGEYEVELLTVPEGYTAPQTAYILESAEMTLILNE